MPHSVGGDSARRSDIYCSTTMQAVAEQGTE